MGTGRKEAMIALKYCADNRYSACANKMSAADDNATLAVGHAVDYERIREELQKIYHRISTESKDLTSIAQSQLERLLGR